jgi:ABC-type transport system substrate-binding protein
MNSSPLPAWRQFGAAAFALAVACVAASPAAAQPRDAAPGAPPKVLRLALGSLETGFDPAQISDVVSAALVGGIFDAPLAYDFLARPYRLKPGTAAAMPEVSDGYTRFVFRIRPGILFADDPAFGGRPRELTAADYVYSIKRVYDPKVRSPVLFHFENAGLLELSEMRRAAIEGKTPFPYDREAEGLRVLDRYTFEVRTARPAPRLLHVFAIPSLTGAVAREVVHDDPARAMQHPVGTGPFRLASWTRGARIVLERNPNHRHAVYDERPPADADPATRALAERWRGRPLPFVDRVELSVIEEAQPRWLAFLNGEIDVVGVPPEFVNLAAPNGRLAPNLAQQGIVLHRSVSPITLHTYFGMENPVVGGYAPAQVALRRAIALAYDGQREIDLARRGQMIPAQSVVPPGVSGFDPDLKTEMSDHDPARAKALLDLYGFVDRDRDGWRDRPDGQPLVLEYAAQPDQLSRQLQELWKKSMNAVGLRIEFRVATWPENIKASRAGRLMMWGTGWSAALPDGGYFLDLMYGPNKGQANHARFALPAFDALYEKQRALPDGPDRDAIFSEALRLATAYMPYKAIGHGIASVLVRPQVLGYSTHPFVRDYWRYLDVEGPSP